VRMQKHRRSQLFAILLLAAIVSGCSSLLGVEDVVTSSIPDASGMADAAADMSGADASNICILNTSQFGDGCVLGP
jgi:hypothetical protein